MSNLPWLPEPDPNAPKPVLGILGLGVLGEVMARRLVHAGYRVFGFEIGGAASGGDAHGVEAADAPREVVDRAEIVLVHLPSSAAFAQVAEDHLLPHARSGQCFVDLGTTSPQETRRLAAAFAERGAVLLDAPYSGTLAEVERGSLHFYLGGDAEALHRCCPILGVLGGREHLTYCGDSGTGQIVKATNHLLNALGQAAMLEAAAFGVRSGVDIDILRLALGGGTGWHKAFAETAKHIEDGRGETVGVRFHALPACLQEAHAHAFPLPLTKALFTFCEAGEKGAIDDHQPAPSFWHELTTRSDDTTQRG